MNDLDKIIFYLIEQCVKRNADEMTLEKKGVTKEGNELGDWEIIIRKK